MGEQDKRPLDNPPSPGQNATWTKSPLGQKSPVTFMKSYMKMIVTYLHSGDNTIGDLTKFVGTL